VTPGLKNALTLSGLPGSHYTEESTFSVPNSPQNTLKYSMDYSIDQEGLYVLIKTEYNPIFIGTETLTDNGINANHLNTA